MSYNEQDPVESFANVGKLAQVTGVRVGGDANFHFVGFVSDGIISYIKIILTKYNAKSINFKELSSPAVPVGENVTFVCPDEKVFFHNRYIKPELTLFCQVICKYSEFRINGIHFCNPKNPH